MNSIVRNQPRFQERMHDSNHHPTPPHFPWTCRRSRLGRIGLLLGLTLLFSVYLWSAREPGSGQSVDIVTLRPPVLDTSTSIEIVPFHYPVGPRSVPCPNPNARLCLVIGAEGITPVPTTFT